MTDDELKEIEARANATPGGPWEAVWISRNPTAFPTAMDYAESLEKELRAAREALRDVLLAIEIEERGGRVLLPPTKVILNNARKALGEE